MAGLRVFDNWIGNEWVAPAEGSYLDSIDPTTGDAWASWPSTSTASSTTPAANRTAWCVLAVVPFDSEAEAIRLANDTSYGLAAGVWTNDQLKAMRMAEAIEAGTVYLNNYFNSATQSPVGGYKQSGYGRENGVAGLDAFLQTKSVWMRTSPGIPDPFPQDS